MEKNSIYHGMVNMRKLTMINPAALMGPSSGDGRSARDNGTIGYERRRRNERRISDNRRGSES